MAKPRTFKSQVLERRIKRFENAAISLSWSAAQPPEDYESIEEEYKEARLALWTYIMEFILNE